MLEGLYELFDYRSHEVNMKPYAPGFQESLTCDGERPIGLSGPPVEWELIKDVATCAVGECSSKALATDSQGTNPELALNAVIQADPHQPTEMALNAETPVGPHHPSRMALNDVIVDPHQPTEANPVHVSSTSNPSSFLALMVSYEDGKSDDEHEDEESEEATLHSSQNSGEISPLSSPDMSTQTAPFSQQPDTNGSSVLSEDGESVDAHSIKAFVDPSVYLQSTEEREVEDFPVSASMSRRGENSSHFGREMKKHIRKDRLHSKYILDSGATEHMSPYQSDFQSIDYSYTGHITFGNGEKTKVKGTGVLNNGLENVLYVPVGLKVGLISVSALDRIGCRVNFSNGVAHVYRDQDTDHVWFEAKQENRLYQVMLDVHLQDMALTSRTVSHDEYKRLGLGRSKTDSKWNRGILPIDRFHKSSHMGIQAIIEGVRNDTLIGTGLRKSDIVGNKNKHSRPCIACMKGGADPLPLYSYEKREDQAVGDCAEKGPMYTLHMDVKGAFLIPSTLKERYLHVATTRPCQFMFVLPMKSKDQALETTKVVFQMIKQIYREVPALNNKQPAVRIYTDAESIYVCEDFEQMCNDFFTAHPTSAPYKHGMNGVIEGDIKRLFKMARINMLEHNVPLLFWKEAVLYAVYVWNRTPRKEFGWKSPYQMVYGEAPDVSMMNAFYAPGVYILTEDERKNKQFVTDARAMECRFLGVQDNAYVIWVPKRHKMLRRRDCLFEQHIQESLMTEEDIKEFLQNYPDLYADALNSYPNFNDFPDFYDKNEVSQEIVDEIDKMGVSEEILDNLRQQPLPQPSEIEHGRETAAEEEIPAHQDHDPMEIAVDIPMGDQTPIHASLQPEVEIEDIEVPPSPDGTGSLPSSHDPALAQEPPAIIDQGLANMASLVTSNAVTFRAMSILFEVMDRVKLRKEARADRIKRARGKRSYLHSLPITVERHVVEEEAHAVKRHRHGINLGYVPDTIEEAICTPESDHWIEALKSEMDNLFRMGTMVWPTDAELRDIARQVRLKRPIDSKFVLDRKMGPNGEDIFKVRLAVRGFKQVYMIDYDQTYSPTLGKCIMRVVMYICLVILQFHIELVDFKQAFAQSEMKDPMILELPRFVWKNEEYKRYVFLLKALYGLKQAALVWYQKLHGVLTVHLEFKCLAEDGCVFIRYADSGVIEAVLTVHVDDMTIACKTPDAVSALVREIESHLPEMKRFREFNRYLGMDVCINTEHQTMHLSQHTYIDTLCNDGQDGYDIPAVFEGSKRNRVPMDPAIKYLPRAERGAGQDPDEVRKIQEIHGTLRYLCDNTRPDISVPLGILSQCVSRPVDSEEIFEHHLNILRYLRRTQYQSLKIGGARQQKIINLFAFSDASFLKDNDSLGRLGGVIYLNHSCGAVHWKSVKEQTISLSVTECEVKAIALITRHIIGIRDLLTHFSLTQDRPTPIYIDSKSGKALCESFKVDHKSIHYNAILNFVRQEINRRTIELIFIRTEFNVADLLTKNLLPSLFEKFRQWIFEGIPHDVYIEIMEAVVGRAHNAFNADYSIVVDWYSINN